MIPYLKTNSYYRYIRNIHPSTTGSRHWMDQSRNSNMKTILTILQNVPVWKYAIGFTIATPLIAILQGTYLLHEYRRNHSDAPIPDVPSRGLVVVSKRNCIQKSGSSSKEQEKQQPAIAMNLSPLKRWNTNEILRTTITNTSTAAAITSNAISNDNDNTAVRNNAEEEEEEDVNTLVTTNTRPLRILIIGDSLAAGVGTSNSSTPILPETIAQALSKAMNGRAVLWTCFGVPGQTSSEIVHSIQNLDDIFVATTKNHTTLLHRFNEWQISQRQLAQHRIESARRKTKEWWIEHQKKLKIIDNDDKSKNDNNDNNNNNNNNNNSCNVESSNRLVRWWKRTRIQLKNDLQTIRTIFKRDDDTVDEGVGNNQVVCTTSSCASCTNTLSLSEQAMMMGEYDIAIVFTGLNDIKESYLPFMRSSERSKELQQLNQQHTGGSTSTTPTTTATEGTTATPSFNDNMRGELIRILNALLDKRMHQRIPSSPSKSHPNDEICHDVDQVKQQQQQQQQPDTIMDCCNNRQHEQQRRHSNKGPLIVFPALPYQPTLLSQYPPLSWFMIPLLNMVDENKKLLSELYPGLVLFVESPDIHDWSNATLAQHGTVWEDFFVLFKLNDIAQDANERIIRLMKRHYERWVVRDGAVTTTATDHCDNSVNSMNHNCDETMTNKGIDSSANHSSLLTDDDSMYEIDMMGNVTTMHQDPPPQQQQQSFLTLSSLMVAADGIHPSDIGYDMWGRHIADAIIKEWEKVG